MYSSSPPLNAIVPGGVLAYTGMESMPMLFALGILMIVGSILLRIATLEQRRTAAKRH